MIIFYPPPPLGGLELINSYYRLWPKFDWNRKRVAGVKWVGDAMTFTLKFYCCLFGTIISTLWAIWFTLHTIRENHKLYDVRCIYHHGYFEVECYLSILDHCEGFMSHVELITLVYPWSISTNKIERRSFPITALCEGNLLGPSQYKDGLSSYGNYMLKIKGYYL